MKAASAAAAGQQASAASPTAMYPAMENLRQALYNFHRGTAAAANGNVALANAASAASAPAGTAALDSRRFTLMTFSE